MRPRLPGRSWRKSHICRIFMWSGNVTVFASRDGRAGPRGNERLRRIFEISAKLAPETPLDIILITGDITDAGLSSEWAEFFDALMPHRDLSKLILFLPGNHDLNVVDKTNPARLDLPTSPRERLRPGRMLSALEALQGSEVRLVDDRPTSTWHIVVGSSQSSSECYCRICRSWLVPALLDADGSLGPLASLWWFCRKARRDLALFY